VKVSTSDDLDGDDRRYSPVDRPGELTLEHRTPERSTCWRSSL
jgi:hypothetical protein